MKKIILFFFIVFISCSKKELPSDISYALYDLNSYEKISRDYDSLISTLDEPKINNLPYDSLESIIVQFKVNKEMLQERKDKLDEFLKYNPQYSDYEEIKNREAKFPIDIVKNYDLILNRYTDLKIKKSIQK